MTNFIRNKNNKKSRWLLIFLFLGIIFIGSYYFYNLNVSNSADTATKKFVVLSGDGSTKISQNLKIQGLIKNPLVFQWYVWTSGISSRLQDGEYFIPQNLNIKEIAQILRKGNGTKEKTLTFIEGWNIEQMAQYLAKNGFGTPADFLAVVQKKANWWDDYAVLASRPRDRDLEGYLFPDTYRVYGNAPIDSIVKKMLSNLEDKLTPELRQEISQQDKTINYILTLASLIEKEVPTDADRQLVADIFYKRLKAGMPLQSDASVNYITKKGTTRPSTNDLAVDNPYNTYKYKGLPPGPICNPGLSAIKAAIYPKANPYWYFLTTPDGQVIYSKTYQEHLAAKNRYYK